MKDLMNDLKKSLIKSIFKATVLTVVSFFAVSFILAPGIVAAPLNAETVKKENAKKEKENKKNEAKKEAIKGKIKKKKKEKKKKEIGAELSVGLGRVGQAEVLSRIEGVDRLMGLYAQYYSLTKSSTGEIIMDKSLLPLNLSVTYPLVPLTEGQLLLKAGLEIASGGKSSEKTHTLAWPSFDEEHNYAVTNKVSYVFPHVGAVYRRGNLDVHGAFGLGFARLTYEETLDYSEPGYGYTVDHTFKLKGTSPGLLLGVGYRVDPFKKKSLKKKSAKKQPTLIVKLELLLLNIGTLKGTRTTTGLSSTGERYSDSADGTAYSFTWNPNDIGGFGYWDLLESGTGSAVTGLTGVEKLGIGFSCLRVMLGISF